MKTLLIIDDDQPLLEVLALVFKREGWRTITAADAAAGLAAFSRQPVDVVLVDMIMPGADGLSCSRQLRALAPAIPIFLMSGADPRLYGSACESAGVTGIVPKPFSPETLIATLREAFAPGLNGEDGV